MLGNFTYDNPTRLHFGPDALERLRDELPAFGPVVTYNFLRTLTAG